MRAKQAAGNGTDDQRAHQVSIDVAEVELQEAGDSGEDHCMNNVGANHHFGGKL